MIKKTASNTLMSPNKESFITSQGALDRVFVILMLVGSIMISPISLSLVLTPPDPSYPLLSKMERRKIGLIGSGLFDAQSADLLTEASARWRWDNNLTPVTLATNLAKKWMEVTDIAALLKSGPEMIPTVELLIDQGMNVRDAIASIDTIRLSSNGIELLTHC